MRQLEIQRAVRMCEKCHKCYGHTSVSKCPMNQEFGITPFSAPGIFYTASGILDGIVKTSKETSIIPFSCTTCGACGNLCINPDPHFAWDYPTKLIENVRGLFVEEGEVPESISTTLENYATTGNAWRLPKSKRVEWEKKCEIAIPDYSKGKNEYLLFIGDAALIQETEHIPAIIAKILNKAGVDFGTLKEKEADSGNEVRAMGELGLAEELALKNIETFKKYGVKKIITISPHDYVAFRFEYPKLGMELEVCHYTEIISSLIKEGKIKLTKKLSGTVTYHDPCNLGRYNRVYEAPRDIIKAIFPSVKFTEMSLSKEWGFCCGGGGGRMWYEPEDPRVQRVSDIRISHAKEADADIIVTACPFCLNMLQGAGNLGNIAVKDIGELVLECMA